MASIAELARRWSDVLLSEFIDDLPTRAVRETGSVLRPPAPETDIAAAESRLGRTLPPSYREFLLCSDGAYADIDGVSWAVHDDYRGERGHSVLGAAFLPVRDLQWLADVRPEVAALYAETGDELDGDELPVPGRTDGPWEPWPWAPFARGLMISVDHAPGLTCLVPVEGEPEWQLWNIHFESAKAYPSFRVFLERVIAEREPVTTLEQLRSVLEQARTGDSDLGRERLARTTAAEAVPTLVQLIETGDPLGWTAAYALARISTDQSLAALDRLPPQTREHALLVAGTSAARDRLASEGLYWPLAQLSDPRASDLAAEILTTSKAPPNTAFITISRLGGTQHVPFVERHLHAEPETALWAALALIRLGDARGHPRLIELAEDDGGVGRLARHYLDRLRLQPDEPW